MTGENKKPEIWALNTFGKDPILVEGDFVLFEFNERVGRHRTLQ